MRLIVFGLCLVLLVAGFRCFALGFADVGVCLAVVGGYGLF